MALTEKESLKRYENLDPRKRSKFNYVLSRKIRERLGELDEIDEVLNVFSKKTASKLLEEGDLADNTIAALFRLTETLLRILEYAPISDNEKYVIISEPRIGFKDGSVEYWIKTKPANEIEVARMRILKNHIEKLQKIATPAPVTGSGVID